MPSRKTLAYRVERTGAFCMLVSLQHLFEVCRLTYMRQWIAQSLPYLHIGTVIKRTVKSRLTEVLRQMAHGSLEQADKLLQACRGGKMLNTSFIEGLNATMRERLAALTRKCRHASCRLQAFHTGMYLIGCTYNFCWAHHELSQAVEKGGLGLPCTPALASRLTDHVWSLFELLSYKVAPAPWVAPKRRGRPRKKVPSLTTS